MTDKTLPTLSAGTTISGSDKFIARQGSDTSDVYVTATQIASFVGSASDVHEKFTIQSGWYLTPEVYGSVTGSSITLGQTYFVPVLVHQSTTFTAIAAYSTTATAFNAKLGVYADDGSEATGTPISGTTGTVAMGAAAGVVEHTFASPVTLAAGRYWLAVLLDTTTSLNVMPQTGISNYIGVADLVNANGKRFYLPSTPYASGLVDMTAQTFTYQNGLGPVWVGLKAQ